MKHILLACAFAAFFATTHAQSNWTKEQCFAELNKIVKKSIGEKYLSGVFNEKTVLKAQELTEGTVTRTNEITSSNNKKIVITMTGRYTEIPWDDLVDFETYNFQSYLNKKGANEKLHNFTLKFKSKMKFEYFGKRETADPNPKYYNEISDIYILQKYVDDASAIFKRLIELNH